MGKKSKTILSMLLVAIMVATMTPQRLLETVGVNSGVNAETINIPSGALVFNEHSYYVYNSGTVSTWDGAINYCKSLGGHLATISSQEENDAIYNYIKAQGITSAYFGLSDRITEGVWKWETSEEISYTNWQSGEPSAYTNEDYAMFYYAFTNGKWNDGAFGTGQTVNDDTAFICEWDTYDKGFTITNISLPEDLTIEAYEDTSTITANVTIELTSSDNVLGEDIASKVASELTWTSSDKSVITVSAKSSIKNQTNLVLVTATITRIKNTGTATITVSSGDISAQCKVTVNDKPINNLKQSKYNNPKINVEWDKVDDVDGYLIQVNTNEENLTESCKSIDVTDNSYVSDNQTPGESFYVRVSAYKNINGEKKHYSWSEPIKVKVLDIWKIQNESYDTSPYLSFNPIGNSYYISHEDYGKLIQNVNDEADINAITYTTHKAKEDDSNSEDIRYYHLNIDNLFEAGISCEKWGGSCHGLSQWALLTNASLESVANLNLNAAKLYDITDSSESIQSAVNYYQIQQATSGYMSYYRSYLDQYGGWSRRVKHLIDQAESCQNGNTGTILIPFWWYEQLDSDGNAIDDNKDSHDIIAYGVEEGSWKYDDLKISPFNDDRKKRKTIKIDSDLEFTKRLLIYDCAHPYDPNYDWYITDDGTIYIPGWFVCMASTEDADSGRCTDNGGFYMSYDTSNLTPYTKYNTELRLSDASVDSNSDNLTFDIVTTDADASFNVTDGIHNAVVENGVVTSSNYSEDIAVISETGVTENSDSIDSTVRYLFPVSGKYIFTSSSAMSLSVRHGDYLSVIDTDCGGTITIGEKGSVDVKTEYKSDTMVSLTNNVKKGLSSYPSETALCNDSTSVSMGLKDSGVIIESDNMEDTKIQCTDYENLVTNNVSSKDDKIFVSESQNSDKEVVVSVDSNNDGSFDQVISVSDNHKHTWGTGEITKQPSCTEKGVKTYTCSCGMTKTEDIAALGHTWDAGVITKQSSTTEEGIKTYTCTVCGATKTESIAKLPIEQDSQTTQATQPTQPTQSTQAAVVVPGTTLTSVKNVKTRKLNIKWLKNTAVNGYVIQMSTNKAFTSGVIQKMVYNNQTASIKSQKLKKKKTYYVRVCTYMVVNNQIYYSNWSNVKKVKIKK